MRNCFIITIVSNQTDTVTKEQCICMGNVKITHKYSSAHKRTIQALLQSLTRCFDLSLKIMSVV